MKKLNSKYILFPLVIILILSLVLAGGCAKKGAAPPATSNTVQPNILDKISAIESRLDTIDSNNAQLEAKLSSMEGTVKSLPTSNNSAEALNKANEALSKANDAASKANDAAAKTSSITAISADIAASKNILTDQQNQLNSLSKQLNELKTAYEKTKTQVDGLVAESTATPTPTSTPDGTTSPELVTVAVAGNVFTGATLLSYPSITPEGNTQSLNFSIDNKTGKTISNISLAAAFVFINPDTNSPVNVPSINATLSTVGLTPVWSLQTGTDKTMLVFVTQSGSGVLGSLYNFTQGKGKISYTLNLTLTSKTVDNTDAYNVYPIIRLLSYQ